MRSAFTWFSALWFAAQLHAAELVIDFGQFPLGQTPPGFRPSLTGQGEPGNWKVIEDESTTPPAKVLAQLSEDMTDERFPLLIYNGETFGDFTLTTRLKNVRGIREQMAGIAFRIQDENNYYYVRASSLGNTFRFFKIVNGQRSAPIGPEIPIPNNTWHELTIECTGNRIRCLLNGRELIPTMTDNSFTGGKIGFWTKSDSVSYFGLTKLVYTPRLNLAKSIIQEMLQHYPRLVALKIYTYPQGQSEPRLIASTDESEIGKPGDKAVRRVLAYEEVYYGKNNRNVTVTLPLRDRNGDTVAAVRFVMKSFKGQTEQNAIARAMPILKRMEARVVTSRESLD